MIRPNMASLSCFAAAFVSRRIFSVSSFVVQNPSKVHSRRVTTSWWKDTSDKRSLSILPATVAEENETSTVPITLLSGFLGSGKTTTLQHLLENRDGLKIGVIVNDMASINIDAKLVKNSDSSSKGDLAKYEGDVVQLENGCACCSLADELLTTVENLLKSRRDENSFDAVVVELSGVADPIAIQQNWKTAKMMGHPVTELADMKRIVTLIDSSTFGTDFMTWDVAAERDGWVDPNDECAGMRKVPELLAEQIETADVLLLNKIDLAGPEQLEVASNLAKSINDKAIIEEVAFGKVTSPKQIIRDDKASVVEEPPKGSCCSNPNCPSNARSDSSLSTVSGSNSDDQTHDHSHSHDHGNTSTDDLGITSFVYRADRPFETMTLMSLLHTWPVPIKDDLEGLEHFSPDTVDAEDIGRDSPFFGVLRSKGFCWLAPTSWDSLGDAWRHETAMYWSHAGKHFGITTAGKWWATINRNKMKDIFQNDPKEYERIISEDFVSKEWGDRRQEIVFIGANIDEEEITKALDECLLDEAGMKKYSQQLNSYLNTV